MNTLRKGSRGSVVQSLQLWLANFEPIAADGIFGPKTEQVLRRAQARFGLEDDGVVGPLTAGRFMLEGWLPPGFEQPRSASSPYPQRPDDYRALSMARKLSKWGTPGTAPSRPVPGGAIRRNAAFSRSIIRLDLREWFPRIGGVKTVDLHQKVEKQWCAFFDDVVRAGLRDRMETCAGSWNPRFVRGSTVTFSSHAFATAIDFNAPQNWLGAQPAKRGSQGSLVEVIPLTTAYKIWWGGWFSRVDGMHFESTATDDELGLEWA